MYMTVRICEYRNCLNTFSTNRSNKKYCCIGCKYKERTYVRRDLIKLKSEKEHIRQMIKDLSMSNGGNTSIIDLYRNLYA